MNIKTLERERERAVIILVTWQQVGLVTGRQSTVLGINFTGEQQEQWEQQDRPAHLHNKNYSLLDDDGLETSRDWEKDIKSNGLLSAGGRYSQADFTPPVLISNAETAGTEMVLPILTTSSTPGTGGRKILDRSTLRRRRRRRSVRVCNDNDIVLLGSVWRRWW